MKLQKSRRTYRNRLAILCGVVSMTILCCAGCGKKQDAVLLEHASPNTSALCVLRFDGQETVSKWLYDAEEEKKIIAKINKLPAKSADPSVLADWGEPCYGITITDEEGMEIWLTYYNGTWLTKDGSVYTAEFDVAGIYDSLPENGDVLADSGIFMPNAAILCNYNMNYYGKTDPDNVNKDLKLKVVRKDGPIVTATLSNLTDQPVYFGEYYTLEKEISGIWYKMPVALSNYGFNDIATELPANGSMEVSCDLTMYGELAPGHYRIEKERAYAEFIV